MSQGFSFKCFYDSPIGCLQMDFQEGGLYSLSKVKPPPIGSRSHRPYKNKTLLLKPGSHSIPRQVKPLCVFLDRYFSKGVWDKGLRKKIHICARGTDFQQKVWRALGNIPYGSTLSYTEVAKRIGVGGGSRAVGQACGKNPFLIVVPCHRVVAQKGLGGFALGLKVKRFLLQLESGI